MADVEVRDGETIEQTLKRFRVKVRKEGLMEQMRRRMAFEEPSKKRRRRQSESRFRLKRAQDEQQNRAPVESVPYGDANWRRK